MKVNTVSIWPALGGKQMLNVQCSMFNVQCQMLHEAAGKLGLCQRAFASFNIQHSTFNISPLSLCYTSPRA